MTYFVLNTTLAGKYHYAMAGQLVSYIIQARTGMTPEAYAGEKVFPYLGIEETDYEWYVNPDQVQTAFHGLKMTATAMSKLGMLYAQDGMANEVDEVVDPSWIGKNVVFDVS